MAEPKTKAKRASVGKFLKSIKDDRVRADSRTIAAIMKQATKASPKMWGSGIVGFGTRTIKYAGGRETEWMRVAFAPRKGKVTLYISRGFPDYGKLRARLGKHTGGGVCIHIKSLADIDLQTLRKLVGESVKDRVKR
ncbi:MAG TPA: DUF1801 domain-containing protein [Vicinamibacterales bacterium]